MEQIIGKFERLFSIKILHPWFKDNACTYLSVEPDVPTKIILRKMHLVAKHYDGEIKIIAEINEIKKNNKTVQQPMYAFSENQHLIFLLRLTNTQFFEITELDFSNSAKEVFYFSNSAKGTKLSIEKCMVTDGLLTVNFDKDKIPVKEKIIASDKKEVFQTEIKKNATAFKYDLSGHKVGVYSVITGFTKTDKIQTQIFYYDPYIRRLPIFGIVDIDVSDIDTVNDDKNNFIISFEKKKI
jgi:hypothetical protein